MGTPWEHGDGPPGFAAIRQATAKYHDLDTARTDGYVPLGEPHCVDNPGVGAMGFHYYNPTLLRDGVLDPTEPELLVYAPSGNGARLAAVECMMPLSTWSGPAAPSLFGVPTMPLLASSEGSPYSLLRPVISTGACVEGMEEFRDYLPATRPVDG